MNGVSLLLLALLAAGLAVCFLLLKKEKGERAADFGEWRAREEALRRQYNVREGEFLKLSSTLDVLFGLSAASADQANDASWAEAVLKTSAAVAGAGQGALLRLDPLRMELTPLASFALPPASLDMLHVQPGSGTLGRAAQASAESWTDESPDGSGVKTPLLLWPLLLNHQPAALLLLADLKTKSFDSDTRDRLMLLMRQAALSLSNLDLSRKLRGLHSDLVATVARAIDARDAYTHQHSDRTRALVQAMTRELRLPAALSRHIEYGALLHDVGKIGIDDAILRKPGKLTPEEYEFMKQHPAIGYRILESLLFLRPAASIVLYHQEWYNGQGYPEGLAGEEIPLGARLVSVIDAWDAMTSNRVYRPAMPKAAAVAELRRQAGTQFDPKMVETFLRVLDRMDQQGVPTTEAAYADVR